MEKSQPGSLSVLWAFDGGAASNAAATFITAELMRCARHLRILTIAPVSYPLPPIMHAGVLSPGLKARKLEEAEAISRSATGLLTPGQFEIEPIARWGSPAETILSNALENHSDIVVMGSGTAWQRALGSTSLRVMQAASVPVFVCRGSYQAEAPVVIICKSPADFLPISAFMQALEVRPERLHFLSVLEPARSVPSLMFSYRERTQSEAGARLRLQRAVAELMLQDWSSRIGQGTAAKVIREGALEDEVATYVAHAGATLVVTAAPDWDLADSPHETLAEKLVKSSPCSVLVVR